MHRRSGQKPRPEMATGDFGQTESLPAGDGVMSAEIAAGNLRQ
jgi:hypothetical protein